MDLKRASLILEDLERVFNCDIEDWMIMAGACVGVLNAYGYKRTPGWFDKEIVIGYPGMEEEAELELGEWINFGTKNPNWRARVLEYLDYIEKLNK